MRTKAKMNLSVAVTFKNIIIIIIIIIITKLLLHQYPRKEPRLVAHLVEGLGKLIVRVRCKVHQQMIRWSGNVGRMSESEKVSF